MTRHEAARQFAHALVDLIVATTRVRDLREEHELHARAERCEDQIAQAVEALFAPALDEGVDPR